MKYIKLLNENQKKVKPISIIDLKNLPYKDFIQELRNALQSSDFRYELTKLLTEKNIDLDYGSIKNTYVKAKNLIPTQSQIGLNETLKWLSNEQSIYEIVIKKEASLFDSNKIFIANNKWIIDGHHRWSYVYMLNPKAEIPCININLPEQKPTDILKDVQIAIATTYGDLYYRDVEIENNISEIKDDDIYNTIATNLSKKNLENLQKIFVETDFKKYLLRTFIVPKSFLESNDQSKFVPEDDFSEEEIILDSQNDAPEIQNLDGTDNDPTKLQNITNIVTKKDTSEFISNVADVASFFDPIGIFDAMNAVFHIYGGDYTTAFFYIISIMPFADFVTKPIISMIKSGLFGKGLSLLGKALRKFDAKTAAKIWAKLEKKSPAFKKFMDWLIKKMDSVKNFIAKVAELVGDNWPKFKIFSYLFGGKISAFFAALVYWKKNLKNYLTTVSKEEVYGILASNVSKIKKTIIDNSIDRLNVTFKLGPHPVQSAVLAKKDPYGNKFFGVPNDLLTNIPMVMGGLKSIKSPEKPKVTDFVSFVQDEEEKQKNSDIIKKKDTKVKELVKDVKKQEKTKKIPKEDKTLSSKQTRKSQRSSLAI